MLGRRLHSGTFKTKAGQGELVRVTLFWKSQCATCIPACVILYQVTGLCKGPILLYSNTKTSFIKSNNAIQGRKKQVRLPWASKFCSWASKNRSTVVRWASEINLSTQCSLVCLNKNANLINYNFHSEVISELKTARLVNH